MKKIIVLIVMSIIFSTASQASHLMGGEITWECIKAGNDAGKYIFTVKVYRDCQGVPIDTTIMLNTHNVPGFSFIPLVYIGANDLSPLCDTSANLNPAFSCNGVNINSAGNGIGAVEEHIYQSEPIEITGTPDSNGWHFTWNSCCRNAAINNLAISGAAFTLRAVMYPYTDSTGTIFPNGNTCFDSSPKFYEKPRSIIEVGNGYDPLAFSNGFMYSHNAFDEERDSLSYEFAHPLDDGYDFLNPNSIAIPFTSPLSFNMPIPGIQMLTTTGKTWYDANTQGNYVTCTKVSAFNCGQLVSEIFREIQVVIVPYNITVGTSMINTCNLGDTTGGNIGADTLCNVRPIVQPPFFFPLGNPQFQWDTIVHCGDTVSFDIIANDYDFYPNGSQQDLQFTVSGGQFMDYNTNPPSLCNNPPCATFVETNSGNTPPFITTGGTGSGSFEWITSCNHTISTCNNDYRPSLYTFVIKVQDDFCPAPAIENTSQLISITVCPPCDSMKANPSATAVTCTNPYAIGSISPVNGLSPYYDFWFDMNGIPVNPDSLIAGDYEVRVRDSSMCETIDTVTVVDLSSIINTSFTNTNTTCFGSSDGSANLTVSGGTPVYTYVWSNGSILNSISNVVAGTYYVSITDSNNCTKTDSVIISQPDDIIPTLSSSNNSLFGNATGGTLPYTFEYWGPNGFVASSINNFATTFSINPLISGNYTFIVADVNGCSDSTSIIYSANFSPTVNVVLSNNWCDSLTDLTIEVSQDSGEVDMSTALFESNSGQFDISSMSVGDTIGTASMMAGGGSITISSYLIVSTIISNSQVIIQVSSVNNGNLGNLTLVNNTQGVSITSQTIPDGNSYTSGNMNSVTFNNVFINPCVPLIFTTTIDSELGDTDIQVLNFVVSSIDEKISKINVYPNPVDNILNLEYDDIADIDVIIYNLNGNKVISKYQFTSSKKESIDVSYLKSGVYFLEISYNDNKEYIRFVKK